MKVNKFTLNVDYITDSAIGNFWMATGIDKTLIWLNEWLDKVILNLFLLNWWRGIHLEPWL